MLLLRICVIYSGSKSHAEVPCALLPVFHLIPEATGDHHCLMGFIECSLLAWYSTLLSDVSVTAFICLSS